MKFSSEELAVIATAINTKEDGTQRQFALADLSNAAAVIDKLKTTADKEGLIKPNKTFEFEFSTDEKVLIKGCLNREWPALTGEFVMSVQDKVS